MVKPKSRTLQLAIVAFMLSLTPPAQTARYPDGLDDIFKGIEPGKKFYPLWPAIGGPSPLGAMVSAAKPAKLEATFEPIDSPTFRNSGYREEFETSHVEYAAAEITKERKVGVDVAFNVLDALVQGKREAEKAGAQAAQSTNATPAANTQSTSGTPPATNAPEAGQTPSAAADDRRQSVGAKQRTSTGFDYGSFTHATRKLTSARVEYFTAGTLFAIRDGSAINARAKDWFGTGPKGWVIHRVLRLDGLDYKLTSNKDIGAAFLASLHAWLPGIQVRYVNNRTITLTPNGPVYIGYKLWTPRLPVSEAAASEFDIHTQGIGAEDIEAVILGKSEK
jgi:hypothetical protein